MGSFFNIEPGNFVMALNEQRSCIVTPPWFTGKSRYKPCPHNVIDPLINGQRAFTAVCDALMAATKSIEILSWGFDPSMRLKRPDGLYDANDSQLGTPFQAQFGIRLIF